MSDQTHTEVQETKPNVSSNDEALSSTELHQSPTVTDARHSDSNLIYDKQNSLTEIANSTFRDLCKTLESEQAKLLELEERRKKLQEEMLLLKAEIEEEKKSFNLNIKKSVAENLSMLNKSSDINIQKLITCYEDDGQSPITARNLVTESSPEKEMVSAEEHTQHIKNELQNVITECIIEQCKDITE